jgi:uncharacterized surface protein with fasciclin (FAS1) repeats
VSRTTQPRSSSETRPEKLTFHVITNVWGAQHTGFFLNLTLPNILSHHNLPALVRQGDVVYRFFTTPLAAEQIRTSDAGQRLASLCRIEYVTPLGQRPPETIWHVHWFHRAAAEAKKSGAIAVFVPPDTLWTDGAFEQMGRHIALGMRGVACPFILVTSDTCAAEARDRFFDSENGVLTIAPSQMWSFARRHMHPNQILAMPHAPHARPVFELHWPVGSNGMLSRYVVRELVAFDPRLVPITFLWNADGPEDMDRIHFATDPADMLMLSVDPIGKYIENYILDHSARAFDVSRTSLHPLNNTSQARLFASKTVKIYSGETNTMVWRRRERLAQAAARDIRVGRAAMLICAALVDRGCKQMADLLSVALVETCLSRRWRTEPPLTLFATRDTALSQAQSASLHSLMARGHERALLAALLDHVIRGRVADGSVEQTQGGTAVKFDSNGSTLKLNGIDIVDGPIDLEGVELYIIDGVATNSLAAINSSAALASVTRAGIRRPWRAIKNTIRFLKGS